MNTSFTLDNARDAVIYTRHSAIGQPTQSLAVQKIECQNCANENRLNVVSVYTDKIEHTHSTNRSALRRLIADAAAGVFRYVIVFRDSYLAQHPYDLALVLSQLEQYHVHVIFAVSFPSLEGPRLALQAFLRESTALYAENLAAAVQHEYPTTPMAERIAASGTPLGYAQNGDVLVPNDTAVLVQNLFVSYAKGANLSALETYLQTNLSSGEATSFDVPALLQDEIYVGTLPFELVRIRQACAALIDDDIFTHVQNRLATECSTVRENIAHFMPPHKFFCDKCTAPLDGVHHRLANGDEAYSYLCRNHDAPEACHKALEAKDALEAAIAEQAKSILLAPHNIDSAVEQIMELYTHEYSEESLAMREHLLQTAKGNTVADAKLALFRMRVAQAIPCTHEDILAWLHKLGDCQAENPVFRRYFFDNFIRAAWVNDHRVLVALNLRLPGRADGIATFTAREPDDTYTTSAYRY